MWEISHIFLPFQLLPHLARIEASATWFYADGTNLASGWCAFLVGVACRTYSLLASDDLALPAWETVATTQASANGWMGFVDPAAAGSPRRFYRVVAW